ncbi:MAG: flagellar hook-basal body complex protein [Verrucomicrobiales bacterium]|nr:flagellar hook-basal body complex protein [Verrucomicrobiales bacterium]
MLRSLTSAISGLQNFQGRMDVIGNNIANVNTTGFKAGRVDFADSFSQTLRSSNPGDGDVTGTSAMQIGSGVTTGAIRNLYTQGAVARTGVKTDLAVSGEGYFVVRDPVSGTPMVTRAGDFRVDDDGYIVNNSGLRLQGYSDAALGVVGDIKIDLEGKPAGVADTVTMSDWAIDREGKINVSLSDGSQFVRGQILLQKFSDPQGLVKEGNNLYSGISAAGPLGGADSPTPGRPTLAGLGSIQSGSLELSNVDLANEFSSMITAQRAFQATARIISTSDEMLQELVNLKR